MNRLNAKFSMVVTTMMIWMMTMGVSAAELTVVENYDHPSAIPAQYVMTFEDAESMMDAVRQTEASGGTILHTYRSINGFAAELPADALLTLRTTHELLSIEANVQVQISDLNPKNSNDSTPLNWGIDRIDGAIDDSYNPRNNGDGVNVYLLDSGIDGTNPLFSGRVVHAFDNVGDGETHCGNHGTGIASIIGGKTGVANGVTLHSVRVLDCNLVRGHADVLAGLDWIVQNVEHPAVVNTSIALYGGDIYNQVVETLLAQGVTVVTAAGNDNRFDACDVSPAGANGVITVGATDIDDTLAWFNSKNEGGCINSYAPGIDMEVPDDSGRMIEESGTSYAAPHVTGCVARYLQFNPTATPADVLIIIETASANGVLDCSFADAFPIAESSLNLNGGGFDLSFSSDAPLAVSVSNVAVDTNGATLTVVVLLAFFSLFSLFSMRTTGVQYRD